MSKEEREKLQNKEQRKHAGAALNNAFIRTLIGSSDSGCFINILSILMIILFIFIIRACSN